MAKLEECVRSIEMPGLVWGASKLVPIGYGIRKLQITLVVGEYIVGCMDDSVLTMNVLRVQRTSWSPLMSSRRRLLSSTTTSRAPMLLLCRVCAIIPSDQHIAYTSSCRALDSFFLVSFGVFGWMYWCDVSTTESSNFSCCNQVPKCSVALIPL